MNNYPQIAIVIPVYNEEMFIEKCLNSIFEQSYPGDKMDIFIVDGRSEDKTLQIVKKIMIHHPNIRILDNPMCLQSFAFNIGVANSTAPYVVRLDAHVRYEKSYIERCIDHLVNNQEIGNVGGRWIIRSQGTTLVAQANALLNQSKFGIGGAAFRVSNRSAFVETVPFGAFPRRVLEAVGDMNTSKLLARGEDNEFNARIRKAGYKILFDPEIKCEYFARQTMALSVNQMYRNGVSIGALMVHERRAVSIRHLIPFAFVTSLLFLLVAGFFYPLLHQLLLIEVGLYSILNLFFSMSICIRNGFKHMLVLPCFFLAVHVSYGVGTVIGILRYLASKNN